LVEGGSITIQQFIDKKLWNKAIIYKSLNNISDGISRPIIKGTRVKTFNLDDNKVEILCSI
jgi:riboflavin biosynthesis pyrimidine reductase